MVLCISTGITASPKIFFISLAVLKLITCVRLLPFSFGDALDSGRSLELASIFPKCNDGLDKPSYS